MKVFLVSLCLVAIAVADSDLELWQNFKGKHGKLYSNHVEETLRYAIFQSNLRKIEEHNAKYEAGEESWYMAVTQFSDMTTEEFVAWLKRSYGTGSKIQTNLTFEEPLDAEVPDSFDWRTKGAVTAVKNQGNCGGCWAFSAIGVTESHYYIQNKKLEQFSEQQILDCTDNYKYEQSGCNGGLEQVGLQYIIDSGVELQKDYPYKASDSSCKYEKSKVAAQLKQLVRVSTKNPNALKSAIATQGPTTVAVDASYLSLYGGGIYSDTKCGKVEERLNHAMTNIGYGSDNGHNYWLIKNSWGTTFGEQGYIRWARGSNTCGIEIDNYYGTF